MRKIHRGRKILKNSEEIHPPKFEKRRDGRHISKNGKMRNRRETVGRIPFFSSFSHAFLIFFSKRKTRAAPGGRAYAKSPFLKGLFIFASLED